MKKGLCILLMAVTLTTGGCASLLPSVRKDVGAKWKDFEQAKAAFDMIEPYRTDTDELTAIGFDSSSTSSVNILTYLDIIQRFMPNPSISEADLAEGIRDCIAAKDNCRAHEFTLKVIREERYGNVFLDLFNFTKNTRVSGWEFRPLIVMKEGLVVYKMWGGRPNINETIEEKNPLGPLQNSGSFLTKLAKDLI